MIKAFKFPGIAGSAAKRVFRGCYRHAAGVALLSSIAASATVSVSIAAEPRMNTIANACEELTSQKASGILRAEVKPGPANEHIPTIWSQCEYSGVNVRGRKLRFIYKYMVWEMFDVDKLDPLQLDFNTSFAANGLQPAEKLGAPGRASYVFQDRDETYLLMITHIPGPDGAVGQPSMVIASYLFSDPDSDSQARRALLLEQATEDYQDWTAGS